MKILGKERENLVATIYRVLDGERNKGELCEQLGWEEAAIINAILRGIENPDTLKDLLKE